jgi:O-antigen ligase
MLKTVAGGTEAIRRWTALALEALWLASAVLVPLVFNPWGSVPFELPKVALLRAIALLILLLAGVRAIEGRAGPSRSSAGQPALPLLLPALAFGLAHLAATLLSVGARASLWGSYDRQQGLLTVAAYLTLCLSVAANLRTRAQFGRLWAALVWGSAPIVAYGLVQAIGLDPLEWHTDASSSVLSTLGRANFLASYLVLVVPLTAARLASARSRLACALLLTAQLACLALTQARGAWVGLGAAGVAALLAWAIVQRDWRPAAGAAVVVVLSVGFVALMNVPDGPLAALSAWPGLDRLATLADTNAGSTAARLTTWRATLPLVLERPWLGYGPETMRTVFARVFPPQLVYYQGRHVTVDRAHNVWIDLAMSTGVVGVVAFGALLIAVGWLTWRGLRDGSARWRQVLWVGLAAAVSGHITDLQVSFDLTGSSTVFWLTLGVAAALGRGLDDAPGGQESAAAGEPVEERARIPVAALPHVPLSLAVLALAGLICVRPILADIACFRSLETTRLLPDRVEEAAQASDLWPLEPVYRVGLAWLLSQAGEFSGAQEQLAAADRLSPEDPQVWAATCQLYAVWAGLEPPRYAEAESACRRAVELAPNLATYHTALGLVLARQGRLEDGVAELERAVALDETDSVAYSYLADLYIALGLEDEAVWATRQAARWSRIE